MTAPAVAPPSVFSWVPLALALGRRSLLGIWRIPAAMVPLLAMPIFFLVAFSGSFSSLLELPSFPTDNVVSWFAPFAIIQGSAFAGFGIGFATVRDIETGFYDRLLLSPGSRIALLVGPALATAARGLVTATAVLMVALVMGARIPGGALGLVMVLLASMGTAVISAGWSLGLVFRMPNQRSGPILQLVIFVCTFLSTGTVPLADQIGWTEPLARFNPLTDVLALARQGFVGEVTWATTWPGLVALVGGLVVLWTWAATGIRKLTP